MKVIITINFFCCFFIQNLFGQKKEEIVKYNIEKIVTESQTGTWRTHSTTFYNLNGDDVMYEFSDSVVKFIIRSDYADTLLIKKTQLKYEREILVDSQVTIFSYDFDNKGRIIENKVITDSVLMSMNKIIYTTSGNTDTVYYYRNNKKRGTVSLDECCRYTYKEGKTISYCYDSRGWNSPTVKITEYTNSDSLQVFFVKECQAKGNEYNGCKSYTIKMYFKDGRQIKYEDEYSGNWLEELYETDKQGLIIKHVRHSRNSGGEQNQTDILKYYFRN